MQPVFEIAHLADYRGTRKGAEEDRSCLQIWAGLLQCRATGAL